MKRLAHGPSLGLAFVLTTSLGALGCHDANTAPGDAAVAPTDAALTALVTDPVSASTASMNEHEPQIAVAPNGHLVVSFNAYVATGIAVGYRISNDFGTTWGPVTLRAIPDGDNTMSNATVAADAAGNLYMAWAAEQRTARGRSNIRVYAAKAGPTDLAFGEPVQVNDPAAAISDDDLPVIAVTRTGRVHVVYSQTTADGSATVLVDATSTDFAAWTRSDAVGAGSAQSFRNGAVICQAADGGRIYLAYGDTDAAYYSEDSGLALRHSDDDGLTWSAPTVVQTADEEVDVAIERARCVTNGHDVWVSYGISPDAPLADPSSNVPPLTRLRLAHSGDRGATIDARYDVGDASSATLFMNAAIALEPDTGALDLGYYAGATPNDPAATFRRSRSTDGATFSPSAVVQNGLTLETSRTSHQWLGDYVGAAAAAGQLFLVYTDNAGGTAHVAFARSTPTAPGLTDPGPSTADAGLGLTPPSCLATAPFVPVRWAPPTGFAQGACSAAQLAAYVACVDLHTDTCAAFRADVANVGCLGCLETDVAAATHGPLVTQTTSGQLAVIEVNYGGCQAHFDHATTAAGCGAQLNAWGECIAAACGGCADHAAPGYYGPTYVCEYTSWEPGSVCAAARVAQSCDIAAQCNDLAALLPLWCGGGA